MYVSVGLKCSDRSACWQRVSLGNSLADQSLFGPEPHFMREILERKIPILIGDITYTPLCIEYPASPGIDLVYLGSDSTLMLAEVKRANTFNAEKLRRESFHHIFKYSERALSGLIRYCIRRPEEAVSNAIPLLKQWFAREPCLPDATIHNLIQRNALFSAGIVGGVLTPELRKSAKAHYVPIGIEPLHLSPRSCTVRLETMTTDNSINANSFLDDLKRGYEQYEQTDKSSKPRRTTKRAIAQSFFESLNESTPTRFFYDCAMRWNLRLESGTGAAAERSMNARFPDANRRPKTLFSIKRIHEVNIPAGNMRGQASYLRLSQDDISSLIQDIERLLPQNAISISDKDYIQINFSKVLEPNRSSAMQAVADRLNNFRLLCQNNIDG